MKYIGLNELREMFLSFFESKAHYRLESFPLLPIDDDSLLLINSGMAPMKKYFLGKKTPPSKRVTTCQKCIRTPDIENVGKTSRHGTYFEMLGNFSFGDYFKHEATAWAWEFITKVLEIPVDRIYVSVYLDDDEAVKIWTQEVGVPADRIVRLGKEDNFWEIEERKDEAGLGNPKRTVCVIGHKNPDTDSICSAIAYAYLKNLDSGDFRYVPVRAGQISAETQYVLNHFQVDAPPFLDNIGTRVRDMAIRQVPGVRSNISLKNAWNLMITQNVYTLPITNEENQLKGLITVNDIAKSYMEEYDSAIVSVARTPYRNILETLDAEMVVGDEDAYFDKGKVVIAAANPDVMENYIEEHDMVILGNRYESQLCAIEMQAGCIVVCLGAPVSRTIQRLARDRNYSIIVTPLDTYAVARLINQSMPVDFFMKKENLMTFHLADYTENIRDIMSKKRYRDFPILDQSGKYVGMISRRNLLGVRKRGLILVDHNEVTQAVDNVLDAEIMEIIDHHRLGSLETMTPVYFRNQPVGCTSTIIYQIYQEKMADIPKKIAGLMCSAIISDTLLFRSPTCTPLDVEAAKRLAAIAGIECESYAREMFAAGSDLQARTPEEIFYQDFKQFEFGDWNIGIGQITSMSSEELGHIKQRLMPYMEQVFAKHDADMVFFMLTDILSESSELLCYGKGAAELIQEAFGQKVVQNSALLPGVVSRKKQLVPSFMAAINRMTMV